MMPVPKFKSNPTEGEQQLLLPNNVFDLLPADHDCFAYASILKNIDTTEAEKHYSHLGQHAYHPRHIASILIYAYSQGVFSSREIERKCAQDLAFMYISNMNCPNFRVLNDFRKDRLDFFHDCFKQSVKLAIEMDMASLGHVSLDGSKFKANTSKHKAMSYGRMKLQEAELCAEIDELIDKANRCDVEEDEAYQQENGYSISENLSFKERRLAKIRSAKQALEDREQFLNPDEEIKDKKQISFADTDARIMGKGSSFSYSYNGKIVADSDFQIIIAQHVSQNSNDKNEVVPALNALEKTVGLESIEVKSLDNGYSSGPNLTALADAGIDAYVATDRKEKADEIPLEDSERKLTKADFSYDEVADSFTCPAGKKLKVPAESKSKTRSYCLAKVECEHCIYKSRCITENAPGGKKINSDEHEVSRQDMNKKMATPEAKETYKARKIIVEPAFGHIKNNGFSGFSVRGKEKVAGEFSLVCTSYNFKKIVHAKLRGLVRPKTDYMPAIAA